MSKSLHSTVCLTWGYENHIRTELAHTDHMYIYVFIVYAWGCLYFMRKRSQRQPAVQWDLKIVHENSHYQAAIILSPHISSVPSPLAHSRPLVMFADPYRTPLCLYSPSWELCKSVFECMQYRRSNLFSFDHLYLQNPKEITEDVLKKYIQDIPSEMVIHEY